jgi:hypothetical protein
MRAKNSTIIRINHLIRSGADVMVADFLLHAGLHKTATTSLQELVFPNVCDATYTGKTREIIHSRRSKRDYLSYFLRQVAEDTDVIDRLPLHTCYYYLSLLQDYLVARISHNRLGAKKIIKSAFVVNQSLVDRISFLGGKCLILYSCEGLLLTYGQLHPELVLSMQAKGKTLSRPDLPPLFHLRKIFPGTIRQVVIYVRSPIEYLFSRYIQIHTVRLSSGVSSLLTPADYLALQQRLFEGANKYQSVFFHVYQEELAKDLSRLGVPSKLRSFEAHIRDCPSISKEVLKAFGVTLSDPMGIDDSFRSKQLNSTEKEKLMAIDALCSRLNLSGLHALKEKFYETSLSHDLVQSALANRIFNY